MKKEQEQEKVCFIVTPIGNDTDPIRRHIEGIIDAAIRPALGDEYKLDVAHKIYEPGSITKQIISAIYRADLVIANLTNRNPNVMYELAFRHSVGKPTIMIAESGTNLPADIIMERVIFYQNDAQGVLELRNALEKAEREIDFSKIGSPILDVIQSFNFDRNILQLSKHDAHADPEVLPYILDKLNRIEDLVLANRSSNSTSSSVPRKWTFEFPISNVPEENLVDFCEDLSNAIFSISQIAMHYTKCNYSEKKLIAHFSAPADVSPQRLKALFEKAFAKPEFENVGQPIILSND